MLLPVLYWGFAGVWLMVALYNFKRLKQSRSADIRTLVTVVVVVSSVVFCAEAYTAFLNSVKAGWWFVGSQALIRQIEWTHPLEEAVCITSVVLLFLFARRVDSLGHREAVSDLNARYRYVIEADPRAILVFRPGGILQEINRMGRELLGGSEEELIGQAAADILRPLEPEDPHDLLRRILNKEAVEVKQGERILGQFEWSDLLDEQGQVVGEMLCFSDITEDKKFQREIIQSEKLAVVGQLAAATAHEIRNPLTSIKGFLQLIDQRMKGNPREGEIGQYTKIMLEEADRMEKIIRDFLLMTKPSDVTREKVSVNEVIERMLVLVQNQAILRNINVVTELQPVVEVMMHKEAIQQVVLNLLQNALEAMNIGGTLTIRTAEEAEHVLVCVNDTGVGMTEAEVANLGSPFYSTKMEGTGLGLTVSTKIIREHRGRLDVQSVKGEGTTFTVLLPK
jgi:two-component system, sporulation sensor kinase E